MSALQKVTVVLTRSSCLDFVSLSSASVSAQRSHWISHVPNCKLPRLWATEHISARQGHNLGRQIVCDSTDVMNPTLTKLEKRVDLATTGSAQSWQELECSASSCSPQIGHACISRLFARFL